jgi:FkbM family methyltransferase
MLSAQLQKFDRCFEKHNFNELNNLDSRMLDYTTKLFKQNNKNPSPIFFDVGCNAGSFVKVLQYNGYVRNIHCFEPHPKLSDVVIEKYPQVKMNKICLTDNIGTIDINIPLWSVGLSSIINRPVFKKLESEGQEIMILNVNTDTIDNYCQQNAIDSIDFLKIDVEGAEKIVFDGAKKMLEAQKIKMGLFEVGETLKDANTTEKEICDILERCGYSIFKKIPDNYLFHL